MSAGVDAKSVHTHFDELSIATHEIICYILVFRIEIYTIAGNLSPNAGIIIPIPVFCDMMPIVMRVVVYAIGILHLHLAGFILKAGLQREVVIGQTSAIFFGQRNHALVDGGLVCRPVAGKEFAEVFLTEVARVVEHDVENNFHAACMCCIDKVLKLNIFAFVAFVHLGEVQGVITVVVVTRTVGNDRRNPHGRKAQRFDVIEFFDQAFEIAAPSRVAHIVILSIPTLRVVRGIAVVETGSHHKIDGLVAEVGATWIRGGGTYALHQKQ